MYAEVIIEYPVKSLDKSFTYKIPINLISILSVGMKVLIPFNNKVVNGFVLNIVELYDEQYELKEIIDVVDKELILSHELLKLGEYMSKTTLCTKISAYQTMLPTSYKVKSKKQNYNKYVTFISLNKNHDLIENYITHNPRRKKQIEILNLLKEKKEINKTEINSVIYNSLLENNLIEERKEQKYRFINNDYSEIYHKLTNLQHNVYKNIDLNKHETHLIYGITGSGKTEIYLSLIEDVIKSGKTAIMLVSEISLTMQIVKRFYARFKDEVAVLHSALSDGEKHDEYLRIINNKVKIVVGTRSALFAPLNNLGIVIIDEEHSDTYKQDNNPKYNAKDMALFRCKYNNCPLVLGSATPLLDTMARASKGLYKLHVLDKRVGKAVLPEIKLIDMAEEIKKHNYIFSAELEEKIIDRINKNEQIILLLNRRGFSTFVNCSSCGFTYKCPNCDISLTYHKTNNNLLCHYCGYLTKKNDECPNCKEDALNYLGLGTQKLEEYITSKIPSSKVVRMDQDTTTRKGSHDKIIESFKNKEFNILLGTQMISKGLDFKDVTLVGVINADTTLNIPDFKANENTFALLSQVSGRSGRADKKGEVILQTYNPDNYIHECVKNNDYISFYKYEMVLRNKLKYPPYYYLVGVKIISQDYNVALSESKLIVKYLKNNLDKNTIVLGPTTASILKYKNNYRFQVIIKYKKDDNLLKLLKEVDNKYAVNNNISLEIDVNPNRI